MVMVLRSDEKAVRVFKNNAFTIVLRAGSDILQLRCTAEL